ncbi:FAD-dependent oxidoreductase [Microbacterium sediminicola]|uniref:FAD-dependent oxidoreductase n=1 Tax=Microbacterium sediminicola TaxID=415210 RepID=A0ABP4U516_9MICO
MRILIVGGVAAGMSAAARARRHDENAEIIVLERGPEVSFANCGLPYHVGGEIPHEGSLLLHTPETLKAALNLDVRTGHDVTALDTAAKTITVASASGVEEMTYDALILAPGAAAVRPPLPGLDSPRVRTLRTVSDAVTLKKWVDDGATRGVVLGAGFIGLEAAEALRHRGLEVDVVELAPHVLPPLEKEMATVVTTQLRNLGIRVHAGVAAEAVEVSAEADTVILSDGTRIETDLVVLSVGVRPDTAFIQDAGVETIRGAIVVDDHGRTSAEGVWAAGDAVISTDAVTGVQRPVPLAGPANRAGRLIADDIFGMAGARTIPQPIGTAIVRVGEITAAMTGANRQSLDAAGIAYTTLHLHPMQHAGYFPGAATVHLMVHIADEDGRVLGAQAVGYEGIDKRIDVLATAIRAGLVAEDLMDLDLAYSPPYGQAKDPVNLVGMVAENVRNGRLAMWYAQDLEQVQSESLLLDVRTRREFASGHIPGSINIPHTELRERIDEVTEAAAGRPVATICASGVRTNIAARVLVDHGFETAALSGGMTTFRQWWGDATADILVKERVTA